MVLMTILCILVALGLIAIWRWGHLDLEVPWDPDEGSWPLAPGEAFRRYLWYVTIALVSGIVAGVVMIGAGGRLAMRLLAITAGEAAQGRITEADEVVGRITQDGTIGFILFNGILGGLLFGFLYMVIRRWLPRGRWGGIAYGSLLLIIGGSRIDPLRAENPDFDIVGPGWLALAVFVALGLAYGMLVSALAGRYSRVLPLITKERRTIARYAPLLLLAPAFIVIVPLTIVGLLSMLFSRTDSLDRILGSRRTLIVGRVVGLVLVAIAAPGFAVALADIAARP